MCLPSQTDRVVTEHVHPAGPTQQALSCFKSCVAFAQNEHCFVLVVSRVDRNGLIAFNKFRTCKVSSLRDPQPSGGKKNPETMGLNLQFRSSGVMMMLFTSATIENNILAVVFCCILVRQDVAPAGVRVSCSHLSDVHSIAHTYSKLLLEHGQVDWEAIGRRIKLTAHFLEEKVGLIAQQ